MSKRNQANRPIVVLLHGIRTEGYWHQQFEEIVSALSGEEGLLILSRKYGNFPAIQYAIPYLRNQKVIWLRKILEDLATEHPGAKICIVAHSFGTYLVTEVLKRTPRLTVHSLILCGSVVKRDFEWNELIANNNVRKVVNDCGSDDLWPVLSRILIPGTGDAGTFGFDLNGGEVQNRFFKFYNHGAFFTRTHIAQYWWPFICSGKVVRGPKPIPRQSFLARAIASPTGCFVLRFVAVAMILAPLIYFLSTKVAIERNETTASTASVQQERKGSNDSGVTLSDVITFDSRDTRKKIFSLGECPNGNCYVVERGPIAKINAQSYMRGQIFYIYGNGFKSKSRADNPCYACTRFMLRTNDQASLGGRIIFYNKAPEYYWDLNKELNDLPDVKEFHLAVWIPLMEGVTVEAVSAGRDILLEVEDAHINSIRVRVYISPGTLCTRNEFRKGNLLEFLSRECNVTNL